MAKHLVDKTGSSKECQKRPVELTANHLDSIQITENCEWDQNQLLVTLLSSTVDVLSD